MNRFFKELFAKLPFTHYSEISIGFDCDSENSDEGFEAEDDGQFTRDFKFGFHAEQQVLDYEDFDHSVGMEGEPEGKGLSLLKSVLTNEQIERYSFMTEITQYKPINRLNPAPEGIVRFFPAEEDVLFSMLKSLWEDMKDRKNLFEPDFCSNNGDYGDLEPSRKVLGDLTWEEHCAFLSDVVKAIEEDDVAKVLDSAHNVEKNLCLIEKKAMMAVSDDAYDLDYDWDYLSSYDGVRKFFFDQLAQCVKDAEPVAEPANKKQKK